MGAFLFMDRAAFPGICCVTHLYHRTISSNDAESLTPVSLINWDAWKTILLAKYKCLAMIKRISKSFNYNHFLQYGDS